MPGPSQLRYAVPSPIARDYRKAAYHCELAFEWLDKMVDQFGPDKVLEVKTELYDPIKSDLRWQALLNNWKPDELRPAGNP